MSPTFVFAVIYFLSYLALLFSCPEADMFWLSIAALICGLVFGVFEILYEPNKS